MRVGLAVSWIVHIAIGGVLFFLAAHFRLPIPSDPPHIDIEMQHGEGERSNPGSSPENPRGATPQGAQTPVPPQPLSPQIDQSPTKPSATAQDHQPPQPATELPAAKPQAPEQPPTVPDGEPAAPQAPDQGPRTGPVAEPSPAQAQPAAPPPQPTARPVPPQSGPRSPQPPPRPAPPSPPQPKSELEVHLGEGAGQSVLRDGERQSEPYKSNGLPPYPAYAQRRGMQGTVQLLLHVGADGSVVTAEIVQSSGYPLLDSTAQGWVVKTWRFSPALQNGQPAPDAREQKFTFFLE